VSWIASGSGGSSGSCTRESGSRGRARLALFFDLFLFFLANFPPNLLPRPLAAFFAIESGSSPLGDAFAEHLVKQGFVDELTGADRSIHFLRGASEVDQELITLHAIFAVRAEQF
jgi:hypothetical protein